MMAAEQLHPDPELHTALEMQISYLVHVLSNHPNLQVHDIQIGMLIVDNLLTYEAFLADTNRNHIVSIIGAPTYKKAKEFLLHKISISGSDPQHYHYDLMH
jgi:hypothetical protein